MIRTLFKDERNVFRQMLLAVRAEEIRIPIVISLHVPTLNLTNNVVDQKNHFLNTKDLN